MVLLMQAHVVAAFEQSLSNMTQRLQQLTITSQQKVIKINVVVAITVTTVGTLCPGKK